MTCWDVLKLCLLPARVAAELVVYVGEQALDVLEQLERT